MKVLSTKSNMSAFNTNGIAIHTYELLRSIRCDIHDNNLPSGGYARISPTCNAEFDALLQRWPQRLLKRGQHRTKLRAILRSDILLDSMKIRAVVCASTS